MKIAVYYFSGTGNTKKLAELYNAELTAAGNEVELHCITDLANEKSIDCDADILGIGYPIHAFNAPQTVLRFCKALNKRSEKTPAFIFKTSGEPVRMSDISSLKTRAILKRKGYEVNNEYQYIMPYNIIFRHTDSQAYKMWETAKALVPCDVKHILEGGAHLPKKVFMGGAIAWVLRVEHGGAHLLGKSFKIKKDKCKDCGLCIKDCPAHNIYKNKKGKIKFGWSCMLCTRCAFNCPADAIKMGILNGWKVNGKYSFAPPDPDVAEDNKHAKYCEKAYERYYSEADKRLGK